MDATERKETSIRFNIIYILLLLQEDLRFIKLKKETGPFEIFEKYAGVGNLHFQDRRNLRAFGTLKYAEFY